MVQVGQIGNPKSPLVEPADLANRVNFDGFAAQLCSSAGYVEGTDKASRCRLVTKTLAATLPRTGNLVELRVRDISRESAINVATLAVGLLQKEHQAILDPSVTRLNNNLSEINDSIRTITDERSAIFDSVVKVTSSNGAERKFSENVLLSNLIKADDTELRALRNQKETIVEQLSNVRTFNTRAASPVFAPGRPVTASRALSSVLFAILAVALCAMIVVIRDPDVRKAVSSD